MAWLLLIWLAVSAGYYGACKALCREIHAEITMWIGIGGAIMWLLAMAVVVLKV